jgi:hypothetical protein
LLSSSSSRDTLTALGKAPRFVGGTRNFTRQFRPKPAGAAVLPAAHVAQRPYFTLM